MRKKKAHDNVLWLVGLIQFLKKTLVKWRKFLLYARLVVIKILKIFTLTQSGEEQMLIVGIATK